MRRLSDEEVARIAAVLAQRTGTPAVATLAQRTGVPSDTGPTGASAAVSGAGPELREGIFGDIPTAVEAARIAFGRLRGLSLAARARIITALRETLLQETEALSRLAHQETGLGRVEDKIRKNRLAVQKTPGIEQLRNEAVSGDCGLMLVEPAPYGVIAAITPVTNATSSLICNAIGMIAAGNAVVFNVHPSAKRCGARTIQLINRAAMRAGGPANLATGIAEPTIASAQALMTHPDVRLLVVTGGAGVVQAAMRSGKRAICAGPGNPPVVVDETADIPSAARDIVRGASFDNNIICVDEKEVFVVESVADALLLEMKRQGAYILDASQAQAIERVIFEKTNGPRAPGTVRKELIGRDASVILARIGVQVGQEVRLAVVEVSAAHPLVWTEQMLPVLPVVRVSSADQGIDLAVCAERGFRHTAAMHSKHLDHLSRMAREADCSIFVKNAPCYAGLGEGGEGFSSFTIASPTGEGLTGPQDFTRQRRCVLVDHFRIV